ncbi:esterase [Aureimonas sp. SA4125]|uniref:alpha/beta hydrolase n=1 Tax=Aureimonas sp. SA4125 TaxID=2826993 RepID=UPI001CC6AFD7|nr:alpha/beta hydrolase [Aureimonas sp. SA4125]BDA84121.1 esterase [Aureimonas sp. SA4125]
MKIDATTRLEDHDTAYSNSGAVKGSERFAPAWTAAAESFRAALMADGRGSLDQPYGGGARQAYDFFLPVHPPRGLFVFVHGGYWQRFDKSLFSHLAGGPLARGFAVAIPSYTLCPDVRIGDIVKEIGAFLEHVAAKVDGPITLAGHSAGGHLVARMAAAPSPISDDVRARIAAVLSISGVHDLRPLRATAMNAVLHLDGAEARAESPALLDPAIAAPVTCWVGGDELPEFLRQNALLANLWYGLGHPTRTVVSPGRHHYDVIDDLTDPDSAMTALVSPQPPEPD